MANTIDTSSRLIFILFLPMSVVLAIISLPLMMLWLGGGHFTLQDSEWAALSNACYIGVLPFYALEFVFMRAFFSERRTLAVAVAGVVASASMMVINTVGIFYFQYTGESALILIAGAYTVTRILKVIWLGNRLKRTISVFPFKETLSFVGASCLVALAAGAAAYACRAGYESIFPLDTLLPGGSAGNIGKRATLLAGDLVLSGGAGVVAAAIVAWVVAKRECQLTLGYLKNRFKHRH